MTYERRWIAMLALIFVAGCAGDDGETVRAVSQDVCASEQQWVGGDEGSALMNPGGNCMRCHADSSGAPAFYFAGTVYSSQDADDDCFGVEGANVVVTDDNGQTVEMPTNEAGNFYVANSDVADLTPPFSAKVEYEGRENVMTEPLYSKNCVDCHSGGSAGRIPPRIVIPPAE